jgi:hypothetical protein
MSEDSLRVMYERMKMIEDEETNIRKHLKTLSTQKTDIRKKIEKYMTQSNVQLLEVSGTPDSIELMEQRKYETLTKDLIIKKIIKFFQQAGSTSEFRHLEPQLQAQAIIHAVYTERDYTVIKKLKLKTDKNVRSVQNAIDEASTSTITTNNTNSIHHHHSSNYKRLVRRTSSTA